MQEDAFKEAVLPMLEQAYKQGYEDGQREAVRTYTWNDEAVASTALDGQTVALDGKLTIGEVEE